MERKQRLKNQKELKTQKKFKFSFLKLFFVVGFIYFVYTLYNQQIQINKYNSQISMYQSDIDNNKKLTDYYKSEKANIQTDKYIEDVAREQLGYVKPYEKIFVDINKN